MPFLDTALTARVPELPPPNLPFADNDLFIRYQAGNNLTVYDTLATLRTFILTGGLTATPPVVTGNGIVVTVGVSEAGTQLFPIPSIAGKNFYLRRQGFGTLSPAQYSILSGGGFQLTAPGDVLVSGEQFELEFYNTVPGSGVVVPGVVSGSFIDGYLPISSNRVLNTTSDLNKLLQLRGASTSLIITLPDVDDVPNNTIIPIETQTNNTVQHQITTTGGQFIYLNGQSKTSVFMGVAETLWLFRADDGYHVINDFGTVYRGLAQPHAVYKIDTYANKILCEGQLVSRLSYPRLWEYVQTLGPSFVTDSVWNTPTATVAGRTVARPYRGCFSNGDGVNTFRVPDMMNTFLRSVKTTSGSDTERHLNNPGGYQDDLFKAHFHGVGTEPGNLPIWLRKVVNTVRNWNTGNTDVASKNASTDDTGGLETRPENIGVLWAINC